MTDPAPNTLTGVAEKTIPDRRGAPLGVGGDAQARIPELQGLVMALPPLHFPPAMTLARDRWERLVTSIDLPQPREEVWEALTNPDRLRQWLATCHGVVTSSLRDCTLDFEDGEFFLCRAIRVDAPSELRWTWRWLGIGQATIVTWRLDDAPTGTRVTVTEEAANPPWDWQTWNGGGWPGILGQLAAHLRTGTTWRWPWRRMGPYAQIELPISMYEAWDQLFAPHGLKYWLLALRGGLIPGATLPVMMGDASGMLEMHVREVVQPGEQPPSFLPHITFSITRPSWQCEIPGRIWLEPAGWGRCLMQVFLTDWDRLPGPLQLSERRLVSGFWADAVQRAAMFCSRPGAGVSTATMPHTWGAGPSPIASNQLGESTPAAGHASGMPAWGAAGPMAAVGHFFGRVMNDLTGGVIGLVCTIGDRLGLFRDLAAHGPATAAEFAARTGIQERYARQWLTTLHSAEYLELDEASQRYGLPEAHAPVLAQEGGPMFMGGGFQQLAALSASLDRVSADFTVGAGVPQGAYSPDLREGMERMSASWFANLLVPVWLRAAPAVYGALERGARVADIGCGGGRAVVELAKAFPASTFVGFDIFPPALDRAIANARGADVADRVRIEQHDVTNGLPEPFDVVTMFDALHDMRNPASTLTAVRNALAPNGVLVILEVASAGATANVGRTAAVLNGTGLLYNTPVGLAHGGGELGIMGFSESVIRELCAAAGFGSVRRVPIDNPINALFEVRREAHEVCAA